MSNPADGLKTFAWGATSVICLVIGLAAGWLIWGKRSEIVTHLPEERVGGGGVILERKPSTGLTLSPHLGLPSKARESRRVEVTIQPLDPDCPPVDVQLSTVWMPDGSSRVVAWSADGSVDKGVDIPVHSTPAAPLDFTQKKWASGLSFAGDQAWGVFIQRDVWRVRVGLEVNAVKDGGSEARLMAGWTW